MARKVILDLDPGIDDAVAIAMALFDPRLEIVAMTATGGNVPPEQATANLQSIVALLDPPRLPRLGIAPTDTAFPQGIFCRAYSAAGVSSAGAASPSPAGAAATASSLGLSAGAAALA